MIRPLRRIGPFVFLSALGAAPPVPRAVWTGPEAVMMSRGSVALDGRYACGVDEGKLVVREMPSGRPAAAPQTPSFLASRCLMSPDSRQIAYIGRGDGDVDEIRIVPRIGGASRALYHDTKNPRVLLGRWAPDGKWLLIAFLRADGWTLSQLSISGEVRELHTVPFFDNAAISPDGGWVATCRTCSSSTGAHCIYVLSTRTGEERLLRQETWDNSPHMFFTIPPKLASGYAGSADLLAWSADGRSVLYAGDRHGPDDLWRLPTRDGKAAGPPEFVHDTVGVIGVIGATNRGALYYSPIILRPYLLATLTIDPKTVTIAGAPAVLRTRSRLHHEDAAWSRDGRKLFYYSGDTANGIWMLDIATGGERQIVPELQGYNYYASFAGNSVLTWGMDRSGRTGFYSFEPDTGRTSFLSPLAPDDQIGFPVPTADGKTIFYRSDKRGAIIRLDLTSGREREIYHAPEHSSVWSVRLSPDEREIAFGLSTGDRAYRRNWTSESFRVIPADGGPDRELVRSEKRELQLVDHGITWLPGSRYVLFLKRTSGQPPFGQFAVWRVPAEGGVAERVPDSPDNVTWVEASPDGHKLAVTLRTAVPSEVRVLETNRK